MQYVVSFLVENEEFLLHVSVSTTTTSDEKPTVQSTTAVGSTTQITTVAPETTAIGNHFIVHGIDNDNDIAGCVRFVMLFKITCLL